MSKEIEAYKYVLDLIDAYLDNSPIEHTAEEILTEMSIYIKEKMEEVMQND